MYNITQEDIKYCDNLTKKFCRLQQRKCTEDMIQTGREGMVFAASNFDPEKGASFRTYAFYDIRRYVYRFGFGIKYREKEIFNRKKSLALLDIFGDNSDIEKQTINKDFVSKCLAKVTEKQRHILTTMLTEDKNFKDMERLYGKTHQAYSLQFRLAKDTIQKRLGREW